MLHCIATGNSNRYSGECFALWFTAPLHPSSFTCIRKSIYAVNEIEEIVRMLKLTEWREYGLANAGGKMKVLRRLHIILLYQ
jgi:hypothetical protein